MVGAGRMGLVLHVFCTLRVQHEKRAKEEKKTMSSSEQKNINGKCLQTVETTWGRRDTVGVA